jgi:Rps23 Pro-64 3,4-dihydroxylase Tpa1-like proline 4-hydroxylase
MVPVARWDLAALAARWRDARPFPHLVLDDLVAPETLGALQQAVAQEPHWPNRGEIYDFMGSAESVGHPTLRALAADLGGPAMLAALHAITGRTVERVELRSYVYLAGSYLLPHTDSRATAGRRIAYAYYVWTGGCEGGELELFDATMAGDELVSARPAVRITPRDNRIVLFDVTNASLHQVCEVLAGARVSLTGWFLG